MKAQNIVYAYNGKSYNVHVQLLSPLAWIFLVSAGNMEPFHLEYDEEKNGWQIMEEHIGLDQEIVEAIGKELKKIYKTNVQSIDTKKTHHGEFFVLNNAREDIICFWNTPLRIRVVSKMSGEINSPFELVYYSSHSENPLVFQTIDYAGESPELIQAAIKWYSSYIGQPLKDALSRLPMEYGMHAVKD